MWWLQHHHHRAYAAGREHVLMLSGSTTSLRAFAQAAFAAADLDLADHLESVEALKRPADLAYSAMDPSRIAAQLGCQPFGSGDRGENVSGDAGFQRVQALQVSLIACS
jgi:hypothetical protein